MRPVDDLRALTDPELWAAAASGDRAAFEELFLRHHRTVWAHAWRMTASPHTAEDVTSATFLTAWRRLEEVRLSAGSALPWLLAVATHEAGTQRRGTGRRLRLAQRVGAPPDTPDHADDVATALDADPRQARVLAAVDALPGRYRDVVSMHLLGGVASADTATALGIAEATVRSRTARARALLRATLQEDQ